MGESILVESGSSALKVELGERSYDIFIGAGCLERSAELAAPFLPDAGQVVIVTNKTVNALYGRAVVDSFKSAGHKVATIEVPAGEKYKSLSAADRLYGRLLKLGADRKTVVVALGGGVIGDLAGFVAATFMRGLPYMQIPTTLLAQVDSSVGGKTAVNHRLAKNIIGAFYQPVSVIIDPQVLATLPPRELRTGLGEVVKYALIGGEGLYDAVKGVLPLGDDLTVLSPVIEACCGFKAQVVSEDEKDVGRRAVLNYGHTIGHAIEAVSGYGQYNHGEAIAIGMMGSAYIAEAEGLLNKEEVGLHSDLLGSAGLPLKAANVDGERIFERLRHDKKRLDGSDNLVLLDGLGKPVVRPASADLIKETITRLVEEV